MSLATRRAIYGKMAGDGTLTGLLGTPPTGFSKAIFYQLAPQDASASVFPYVIFQKQAGTPTYALNGSSHETEVWLIKGVDRNTTADRVDNIASRLNELLTDGALTISGAVQLYLRRDSDIDFSEVASGTEYKHSGALYRLLYD